MAFIPLPVMVNRSFKRSLFGENAVGINTRLLAQASRNCMVSLALHPSLLNAVRVYTMLAFGVLTGNKQVTQFR